MKKFVKAIIGLLVCICVLHLYYQTADSEKETAALTGTIITTMTDSQTQKKDWVFLNPSNFNDYVIIPRNNLDNKVHLEIEGLYMQNHILYFWGVDKQNRDKIRIGYYDHGNIRFLQQSIPCREYFIPYCRFIIQNDTIYFSYNDSIFLIPADLSETRKTVLDKSRESMLLPYKKGILYTAENEGGKSLMFIDRAGKNLLKSIPLYWHLEGWFDQESGKILFNEDSNKSIAFSLDDDKKAVVKDYPLAVCGNRNGVLLVERLPVGSGGATLLDNNFSLKVWVGGVEDLEVYCYGLYDTVSGKVKNLPADFSSGVVSWSDETYSRNQLEELKEKIEAS